MLYYMFNKPRGCVTARSDAVHRTVLDYFPPELAARLHPVGRLDKDTCGLLILTDDGRLDNMIMQPSRHTAKTYFFYALGEMNEEKKRLIEGGIQLAGFRAVEAALVHEETFRILELETFMPADRRERYMRFPDGPAFSARLTITEGKKHEVKLMIEALHCRVFYLRREAVGGLSLDSSLKEGEYRPLTDKELALLREKV